MSQVIHTVLISSTGYLDKTSSDALQGLLNNGYTVVSVTPINRVCNTGLGFSNNPVSATALLFFVLEEPPKKPEPPQPDEATIREEERRSDALQELREECLQRKYDFCNLYNAWYSVHNELPGSMHAEAYERMQKSPF